MPGGEDALTRAMSMARVGGFDMLVIPGDLPGPEGTAWACTETGKLYINVMCSDRGLWCARIIAHEVAHHMLGHTFAPTPHSPTWRLEYDAEQLALDLLGPDLTEQELFALEQSSRAYIRPMVEHMLWGGVTQHGEIDVALWAGVDLNDYPDLIPQNG